MSKAQSFFANYGKLGTVNNFLLWCEDYEILEQVKKDTASPSANNLYALAKSIKLASDSTNMEAFKFLWLNRKTINKKLNHYFAIKQL